MYTLDFVLRTWSSLAKLYLYCSNHPLAWLRGT